MSDDFQKKHDQCTNLTPSIVMKLNNLGIRQREFLNIYLQDNPSGKFIENSMGISKSGIRDHIRDLLKKFNKESFQDVVEIYKEYTEKRDLVEQLQKEYAPQTFKDLSLKAQKLLIYKKIFTIDDLSNLYEAKLLLIFGVGPKTVKELKNFLLIKGKKFKDG